MRSHMLLALLAILPLLGCRERTAPVVADAPAPRPETRQMLTDSPWTWAYFSEAGAVPAVVDGVPGRPHLVTEYRVTKVVPVTGTPGVAVRPGTTLVRVEVAARLAPGGGPAPLFQGVPRHHEYTTGAQRVALAGSRAPLPAGDDTVAVLIPVRKTAAWWGMPADERLAYFQERAGRPGHTAIGAGYTDRVYRKLYHTRYAVDSTDHDFLTYFEFERRHESAFVDLLAALRDTARNPEWGFVDREYEIWMTRTK